MPKEGDRGEWTCVLLLDAVRLWAAPHSVSLDPPAARQWICGSVLPPDDVPWKPRDPYHIGSFSEQLHSCESQSNAVCESLPPRDSLKAVPLVRVKAKFTVKVVLDLCESLPRRHTVFLTVILSFTRASEAALS